MAGPNGSRAWALARLWEGALARFKRQAEPRPARALRPGHPHRTSSFPAQHRQKEQSVRSGGLHMTEHKGLSRRLYEEVFGLGRLEAADEILSPDCVSHGPGTPPTIGTDAIKRQATILRTAFPDLRVTLEDQLAEGDHVASRWTSSGTHSGPLTLPARPLPPVATAGAPGRDPAAPHQAVTTSMRGSAHAMSGSPSHPAAHDQAGPRAARRHRAAPRRAAQTPTSVRSSLQRS